MRPRLLHGCGELPKFRRSQAAGARSEPESMEAEMRDFSQESASQGKERRD